MNDQFNDIRSILEKIRARYIEQWQKASSRLPVSERDIVSKIYSELSAWAKNSPFHPHTEVKPRFNHAITTTKRGIKIIDVAILQDVDDESWLESAKNIQAKYQKGHIEARYSSIPLKYFHTVVEVKIQSKFDDAKKDIMALQKIQSTKPDCNCFFVLLNALGSPSDHSRIRQLADQNDIAIVEYTAQVDGIRDSRERRKPDGPEKAPTNRQGERSAWASFDKIILRLQQLGFNIKQLPKLRQYKFWPSPIYTAIDNRCYMIMELKTRSNVIRIHSTLKDYEVKNILSELGLDLDVVQSKLNAKDQFKTAINLNGNYIDKIVDIAQRITTYI